MTPKWQDRYLDDVDAHGAADHVHDPLFLFYRYEGRSDSVWGLALIYLTFNLALVIWMMQLFFDAVPRALEEAAWLDGAGISTAFLRITLPLTASWLAAVAVIGFTFSWNDFFYALILTRTKAMTAPGARSSCLPVVNFTVLVRKWMVSGLMAGNVKD